MEKEATSTLGGTIIIQRFDSLICETVGNFHQIWIGIDVDGVDGRVPPPPNDESMDERAGLLLMVMFEYSSNGGLKLARFTIPVLLIESKSPIPSHNWVSDGSPSRPVRDGRLSRKK